MLDMTISIVFLIILDRLINGIGWIGGIAFAISTIPQAVKVFKTKRAKDLSWAMLWILEVGEIFSFTYVIYGNIINDQYQWPLLINYIVNFFILGYIIIAKCVYDRKAK